MCWNVPTRLRLYSTTHSSSIVSWYEFITNVITTTSTFIEFRVTLQTVYYPCLIYRRQLLIRRGGNNSSDYYTRPVSCTSSRDRLLGAVPIPNCKNRRKRQGKRKEKVPPLFEKEGNGTFPSGRQETTHDTTTNSDSIIMV